MRALIFFLLLISMAFCANAEPSDDFFPEMITAEQWWNQPDAGYDCKGIRRNITLGNSHTYKDVTVTPRNILKQSVILEITVNGKKKTVITAQGKTFNLSDYHFAVIKAKKFGNTKLIELEICELSWVPEEIAESDDAGNVQKRARFLHDVECITLHHCGDAKPMSPNDDPVKKCKNLRIWGMRDRLWWTVPYHFLISADGRIVQGRPWQYMGETGTLYNPKGHFLISAMGNYDIQKPTEPVLDAIARIMVWALVKFNLPISSIKGHKDFSPETDCPGKYLYPFLQNGDIAKRVKDLLKSHRFSIE